MKLTGLASPVTFWVGLSLLAFAPIVRGGNRHVALALLEWLGLLVIFLLLVQRADPRSQAFSGDERRKLAQTASLAGILVLSLAPLLTGLLQLTPIPVNLWAALPGREIYAEALAVAQAPLVAFRPLSLTPDITWVSVLAGIPLTAAFLLAYACTPDQFTILTRALVVFALVQAVLGLMQLGPFPGLYFDANLGGRIMGSFANPNHFASYITMVVPLVVLALRQPQAANRSGRRSHRRSGSARVLWGVALFVLLAAVLASSSRGGAVTCLVVTLLAVLPAPMRRGSASARRWVLVGVTVVLVLVALAVGMDALMSRFQADETGYLGGDRWQMVVSTWQAAVKFWPVGSGLGSFAAVFPQFHPPGIKGFVEHAHNDYVQLLMEGGVLVVVLSLVALALIIRQVAALVRRDRRSGLDPQALLQVGCGLGFLAVLLHSWFDFNLRIPANAILAAFLLGAFLRPLAKSASSRREEVDAG